MTSINVKPIYLFCATFAACMFASFLFGVAAGAYGIASRAERLAPCCVGSK